MNHLFQDSVFFGVLISLAAYGIGMLLKLKTGWSLMNPLLISIILVIAAYIVLMWLFGFLVPTLLVVCLLCFMFAEGKNIPKWQPIVYSIIVTGALYVAFVYMLKLRLPVGTLLDISL